MDNNTVLQKVKPKRLDCASLAGCSAFYDPHLVHKMGWEVGQINKSYKIFQRWISFL